MVDNTDDVIDSREVIERIEEIRDLLEPDTSSAVGDVIALPEDEIDELRAELATLEALAERGEDLSDWQYGETLIRDSYFEDYARELAEDIGAIPRDYSWPASHIDWEAAANALQMDYTSIEFDGVTYWAR